LGLNGEAIYGTRPWKIYGEAPTKVTQGHHSEKYNEEPGPRDVRFTTKSDCLYATVLGWPEEGLFSIESLARGNPYESRSIASIEFISGGNRVTWKQSKKHLEIKVEGGMPCDAAYVFKITFVD
jgi:alpha-L-fucosidase